MGTGMKIYVGRMWGVSAKRLVIVRRLSQDQSVLSEKDLYHFARHSDEGFSWGTTGPGAADLALSILFDHMRAEPSREIYHLFKQTFISNFDLNEWSMSSDAIDKWLKPRLAREGNG